MKSTLPPTILALTVVLAAGLLAGCGDEGETASETPDVLSKTDARQQAKADGVDYCVLFDWYGDAVCDPFCAEPDPDCVDGGVDLCDEAGYYGDSYCDPGCPAHDVDCGPADECAQNSDCAAGQACDSGQCVEAPCQVSMDISSCTAGTITIYDDYGNCYAEVCMCGGFAGAMCPAGQTCNEDPTDSCDPANGGSDCHGLCVDENACPNLTSPPPDFCDLGMEPSAVVGPLGCVRSFECVPFASQCMSDAQCAAGQACSGGVCIIIAEDTCDDVVDESLCAGGTVDVFDDDGHCLARVCMCGGFAGFACAADQVCNEDPGDSCDPANGGADCSGLCVADDFCPNLVAPPEDFCDLGYNISPVVGPFGCVRSFECLPFSSQCMSDEQCAAGQTCSAGVCVG